MRAPVVAALCFVAFTLSGCLQGSESLEVKPEIDDFVQYKGALPPIYTSAGEIFERDFEDPGFARVVQVLIGKQGGEPNVGVTSKGGIFVTTGSDTMRSLDGGHTWKVSHHLGSPATPPDPVVDPVRSYDPMLWVDPLTDRVFANHNFPPLVCTQLAVSDDNGETWRQNPACGALPVLDHQKLGTGPYGPKGTPSPTPSLYQNAVYLCYNAVSSTNCAVSYDGGLTFPWDQVAAVYCGGLNGMPATAPDGTLYVPLGASCNRPVVAVSEDNGRTFEERPLDRLPLGPANLVTPSPATLDQVDPDPEVQVTPDGTAYYMGRGKEGVEVLYRSKDKFKTVEGPWRIAPPDVKGTVFRGLVSGDDGRLGMVYLGTRDYAKDPSLAPNETAWHLFVTWSYDANAPTPTFETQQVTPPGDPVQIGCVWLRGLSNPCRNLLDFIDANIDKDGRLHIAFTDGCTERLACANNAAAKHTDSRDRATSLAIQDHGPSLLTAKGLLPSLGWTTQVNGPMPAAT